MVSLGVLCSVFYDLLSQGFPLFLSLLSLCGCSFVCSLIFVKSCYIKSHHTIVYFNLQSQKTGRWPTKNHVIMKGTISLNFSYCDLKWWANTLITFNIQIYNTCTSLQVSWMEWHKKPCIVTVRWSRWSSVFGTLPYMGKSWVHVPGKVVLALARS